MNKNLNIILSILLLISVITNIMTFFYFDSKLKRINIENSISEIVSSIKSSDNTLELHTYYQTQLNKNLINNNDLSTNYQELIVIHEQLINTISQNQTRETLAIKDKTLLFLNERKKVFENYKLAIDLNSSNYNNVAQNLIKEAEQYKKEIETLINSINKK